MPYVRYAPVAIKFRTTSPSAPTEPDIHRSGSTFAAMSGARVIRYWALLHLRTQTPRSGRERLLSLATPNGLSQVNPCMRICAASIDCSVSVATCVVVACCACASGLKRTAAAASSIDPSGLHTTIILLVVGAFCITARCAKSHTRLVDMPAAVSRPVKNALVCRLCFVPQPHDPVGATEGRYRFGASIGSGSGAGVGPSSALACAGSLSSGSSLNVSLLILPVNLNGGS